MSSTEYAIFCALMQAVHEKAFNEPLASLPFRKATALGFLIEEVTGQLISYKTLTGYGKAVLSNNPDGVNPNISTLDILACFVKNEHTGKCGLAWYHFRDTEIKKPRCIFTRAPSN